MNDLLKRAALLAAGGAAAWLAARTAIRQSRYLDLAGKTVLVTGGSRGLGLVLARELLARKAHVAICARDEEELERARQDLERRGGRVFASRCDVTDPDDVAATVADVRRRLGPIDVLINNAGVISVGPLESQTREDFEKSLAVHFWGPYHASMAVLPEMRARRTGRIVNISSIGGLLPAPHMAAYVAGKFALVGFSKALRSELARDGVFVTTVCPGLMRTGSPRNATFSGRHRAEYAWFVLADSLPGFSVSAEHAADRILRAAQYAEAEVVISAPAKIGALADSIAPELTGELLMLADGMLPGLGGIGTAKAPGSESESPFTRSFLTLLTQRAAERNNELDEQT